jgi:hypothetical protein
MTRKRILQTSFVVKDVYESIQAFLELLEIGPWFVFEHYPMPVLKYRDVPTTMDFTVAAAFSGPMMFELVQQHDDQPSAYRDVVSTRGYGFHHIALPSYEYDRDLARYRQLGFAIANEGTGPPDHGGGRAAYIDTRSRLPGLIELMEVVPSLSASLSEMEATAANWDGSDPIRVHKFG